MRRTTIRWPRRHEVKPTSALRRSVPVTCASRDEVGSRAYRQISHSAAYDVASSLSHTCCVAFTGSSNL